MTELSPDAKALLRKARAEFSPGENQLANVRSTLATQIAASQAELGATVPRSTGAPAAHGAGASWTAAHTIGTAVLIGALGAAGLAMWRARTSSVAMTQVQSTSAVARPSLAKEPLAKAPFKDEKPADRATPSLAGTTGPSGAAPPPLAVPTAGGRAQGRSRPKTDLSHEISAEPLVTAPLGAAVTAPRSAQVTRPPTAPVTPPLAAEDSLAEEVRLLRDARAALDRDEPARALVSLDAHASRFPRGTLYEERLATRVLAMCALGRIDAARLAAQELERAAPRSPHLGRVRASCIGGPASP